jgi:hypothetical protein
MEACPAGSFGQVGATHIGQQLTAPPRKMHSMYESALDVFPKS